MNKRQILTTILSVLLSVFLVAGVVYAVTTISGTTITLGGRIVFAEDTGRASGEGTYLFANGLSIGMATPGDSQGIKMEFDYGVAPTDLTGWGKMVHGLDIKMTMDQDWDFSAGDKPYNATVRGARIQAVSENDISGRLVGAYINAQATGTYEIKGYYTGTAESPGIVGIHARTELGGNATITSPGAAGIVIFHQNKNGATLSGYYRGIQIEAGYLGTAINGTQTGIYFGRDLLGPVDFFDVGIDMSDLTFTTGIDIGDATTGITFTGGYTTAAIQLGTSGSEMTLAAVDDRAVDIYTTSDETSGTIRAMSLNHTMTVASTGRYTEAALFTLTSNVSSGSNANALKAKIDYSENGLAWGEAGVICSELWLPSSTAVNHGIYYMYKSEINIPVSMGGNPIYVLGVHVWGAQKAEFDSVGGLFKLSGLTPATGQTKMISSTKLNELPTGTVGIRVRIGDIDYYIPAVLVSEWN